MRDVLFYYRIFAGWGETAGTFEGALNDLKTKLPERKDAFKAIIRSNVQRGTIKHDEQVNRILGA